MRIKQSICYPTVASKIAIDPLCQAAAEIGFAAIGIWGPGPEFEEMVATIKRHGLRVATFVGHTSLQDGLNKRANHDRIEAELKASIELAAKHDVPGLICLSGNRQPGQSEEEAMDAVADGLRRAVPLAEKLGVNLNLELLNSKVDHPGYQCDHTAWGVEVCKRVSSPRVKLLYDIYHMQIMEGDVIRTIRDNIQWIGHFHTAGNPGRNDMDDTQELSYAGICKAIAETGFDLFVEHEFTPKGEPIAAFKQAFAACNQG
jgi:hydroxypyruvate isomerase